MTSMRGSSALITDIERRKALPIIRSLGRAGVQVIGLSSQRLPMGQFSKYCSRVYHCPDYHSDAPGFLDLLEEVCSTRRPDVFYPIEDTSLSLCVNNPERWRPYSRAIVPGTDTLEYAYDKWKTIEAAKACGIPVPTSYCPSSRQEVIALAAELQGRLVIKPRKTSGSRGMRFVDNAETLLESYDEIAAQYPRPIIQERIPTEGAGVGVSFLLSEEGKPLAIFGHRRIREYPLTGGPSTLRESFRDDHLTQQSLQLLTQIGFCGVAMVEYKFDPRRQQYVLMEINPRFWGSLQLAIHAGVNFPTIYQMASMGLPVEPVLDYPLGFSCRWLWPGDMLHFVANPKRFHLEPSFFQFRGPNLAYDILSIDDPWPVVGITLEAFRKVFSGR
jgi:predicted ATP-grasp superfamily ATP-dependent carboligase